MIDTHSHIYAEEFDADRDEMVQRARQAGVQQIILPNVDSESLPRMLRTEAEYPDFCFAAIGLHPTSVKNDWETEFDIIKTELLRRKYIAIGEIGIDLYWDKTFVHEQTEVFEKQLKLALEYNLPVIIHVRDSFRETMNSLQKFKNKGLRGVFHSFTGTLSDANEILDFGGFYLGINGIATFKNSGLDKVLKDIELKNLVLETDAPYLTPTPYRGKRNEPAYLELIRRKLANIYEISEAEVSDTTNFNAKQLFKC